MCDQKKIEITAFELAQRYVGIKEIPGQVSNPVILAMLKLDQKWPNDDKVPWCSGFMNWIAWHLRLPRSKSLLARSWLEVGRVVDINEAEVGFDVVILKRGSGNQPGPENTTAPGHVGFFAGWEGTRISLLGGNQSDSVNITPYNSGRILGVRRLYG
jgi:uncharacterized protein (TIGR02594 family)